MEMPKKKSYTTPKLTAYGSLARITQGSADGDFLDENFPVGTPRGELTFS